VLKTTNGMKFVVIFLLILIALVLIPGTSAQDISPSLQLTTQTELYDARWSPDGQVLAVAGDWGVKIFDANLQEIAHLQGQTDFAVSVSWNPNSQQLASAGGIGDGTIRIWDRDLTSGEFTFHTELSNNHEREFVVAWGPDGSKLASIGADDPLTAMSLHGETEIWDTATWTLERVINLRYQEPARSLAWSSDGAMIVGAAICVDLCPPGFKTGVYFADVATGEIIKTIGTGDSSINAIALHSSGKLVASEPLQISVYDVQNLHLAYDFGFNSLIDRVTWSPDGNRIAFGYEAAAGGIIDVATGASFRFPLNGSGRMTNLDWHPDGTRVVTVTRLGLIEVWDVSNLPDVSGTPTITPRATFQATITPSPTATLPCTRGNGLGG
jgi:WD40 repeat protein